LFPLHAARRTYRHQATRRLWKATKGTLKNQFYTPSAHVRFGQKQTYAVQKGMSALPPKATSNAAYGMSAKGPKRTLPASSVHVRQRLIEGECLAPGDVDNEKAISAALTRFFTALKFT
jgi:hypothetical protein